MKGFTLLNWLSLAVALVGCALLIWGFIIAPKGQIHESVLIAFGECLLFVGAIPLAERRHGDRGRKKV